MEGQIDLQDLNDTELWELARLELSSAWSRPMRLKRSVPRETVIYFIETANPPDDSFLYMESRAELQDWILKNWMMVNSQLPCSGPQKGHCTVYACPEGRHLTCYMNAKPHFALK